MTDLVLRRDDVRAMEAKPSKPLVLGDGEVLILVEKFALTANVVSYATNGESVLRYFDFFPPENTKTDAIIPTWGFGIVEASRCEEVEKGERLYGYFPMSSYLIVKPAKFRPGKVSFVDQSEHRLSLPAVYNEYTICHRAPFYKRELENLTILLRPLYITSWLLNDFVASNDFFNSDIVIITSASSKTSFGLAFEMKKTENRPKIIGFTSERNVEFVKSLDLYDEIVTYDEFENHPACEKTDKASVVDMAGNLSITERLQKHFAANLKHICAVGNTHWENAVQVNPRRSTIDTGAARPKFFFAPTQVQKRVKEWGWKGFDQRITDAWLAFASHVDRYKLLRITTVCGPENVIGKYAELTSGKVDPREGIICTVWNQKQFSSFSSL